MIEVGWVFIALLGLALFVQYLIDTARVRRDKRERRRDWM